jgi:hypothetical protein
MAVLKPSIRIHSFKPTYKPTYHVSSAPRQRDDYSALAVRSFITSLIKPALCAFSVILAALIGVIMPSIAQMLQLGF